MNRFISCVCLIISTVQTLSAFTPESDGIYAAITVTYRNPDPGDQEIVTEEIAIQLFFNESPVTSANFIGLAEGTLQWYDFETGEVRGGPDSPEPFYDGLIFHRIVPNFVIQTGSRNGLGTDGPGWQIPNEIHPELNHTGGGVVSMANSSNGAQRLNSGGSQFFITMAQFPEGQVRLDALNGRHSIFAQVVEGQLFAQEIARAPTSGSIPLEDWTATVNSIEIIRQGAVANDWDPSVYWEGPVFDFPLLTASNTYEDRDNNPDTAPTRSLKVSWERNRDSQYYLEDSNDLESWRVNSYDRGVTRTSTPEDPVLAERFVVADINSDRRHFYRLTEAELPSLPSRAGERLIINFDPVDFEQDLLDFIPYTPEQLTVDFYDEIEGGFQLKRSDSETLKPYGNVLSYENLPLGSGPLDRDQVLLNFDLIAPMQTYLDYETPTSGTAYIFYPTGRPEGQFVTNQFGSTVTATFTIESGQPRRESETKSGTRLTLTTSYDPTNRGQDPVTFTYTIDLYGQVDSDNADIGQLLEGGYRIARSDTEFIQTGALIYQWLLIDGDRYVQLDFDFSNDIQAVLENDSSGSADLLFIAQNIIRDGSFTTGVGVAKPEPQDKEGDKLILTLSEEQPDGTNLVQSVIDINFYDDFSGGYEATRTDSEANQFGAVTTYQWVATNEETRVDLVYDSIQPMQVYLTPQPNGTTTTGTAKIHFPQAGVVQDATFEYIVDGGTSRPESSDKNGTQLNLNFQNDTYTTLTIDIFAEFAATWSFTRPAFSDARPTGTVLSYQWFVDQSANTDLIFITFDRLAPIQVTLDKSSNTAEVLFTETGTVNTISYSLGVSEEAPQPINKAGTRLIVDLDTPTIDTLQIDLIDSATGTWVRTVPNDGGIDSGNVDSYSWRTYENEFDQVIVAYDFFLDTQLFLSYDNATSGTVTAYFLTSGNFEEGTFIIE